MSEENLGKGHPTLSELLEKRGIVKNSKYADYQDYIERRESKGLRPTFLGSIRLSLEGNMHLALGKVRSVRSFWSAQDRN